MTIKTNEDQVQQIIYPRLDALGYHLRQAIDRALHGSENHREAWYITNRETGTIYVLLNNGLEWHVNEMSGSGMAASCYRCNEFKGVKTHAIDPQTSQLVPLFNPRQQLWSDHFTWVNGGTHIAGLTPTGRATVIALRLNNDYVVEARVLWIENNWHPPIS